eukprot:scaffold1238_cov231-Prasinococcus_capsulatus_cf.AAC.4
MLLARATPRRPPHRPNLFRLQAVAATAVGCADRSPASRRKEGGREGVACRGLDGARRLLPSAATGLQVQGQRMEASAAEGRANDGGGDGDGDGGDDDDGDNDGERAAAAVLTARMLLTSPGAAPARSLRDSPPPPAAVAAAAAARRAVGGFADVWMAAAAAVLPPQRRPGSSSAPAAWRGGRARPRPGRRRSCCSRAARARPWSFGAPCCKARAHARGRLVVARPMREGRRAGGLNGLVPRRRVLRPQ